MGIRVEMIQVLIRDIWVGNQGLILGKLKNKKYWVKCLRIRGLDCMSRKRRIGWRKFRIRIGSWSLGRDCRRRRVLYRSITGNNPHKYR